MGHFSTGNDILRRRGNTPDVWPLPVVLLFTKPHSKHRSSDARTPPPKPSNASPPGPLFFHVRHRPFPTRPGPSRHPRVRLSTPAPWPSLAHQTALKRPLKDALTRALAASDACHIPGPSWSPVWPPYACLTLGHSPARRPRQEPPQRQENGSPRPSRYRCPRMCRHGAAHPVATGYAAPSCCPYQDGNSGGNAKSGTKNARL